MTTNRSRSIHPTNPCDSRNIQTLHASILQSKHTIVEKLMLRGILTVLILISEEVVNPRRPYDG